MNESEGYAVFFFPQALEALGEAIKPYLVEGAAGAHVLCSQIDTSGSLIEMTLHGNTQGGKNIEVELMVPSGMIRMIVSAHSDDAFGFGRHIAEPRMELPVVGPTAAPVKVPSDSLQATTLLTTAASEEAVVEPKN
ncbi:MAG: hypothetical protein LH470_08795 [Lysobacter sp.]|nr:hypothetical protein [Lysobacter sp.]